MTPQHSRLLRYLADYTPAYGHAPSYQQITEHLGLVGKANIHRMVGSLERHGLVSRFPCAQRSLEITDAGYRALKAAGWSPVSDRTDLADRIAQALASSPGGDHRTIILGVLS